MKQSQKQKIVEWLLTRGSEGIKNYEFGQQFILNYKARLDELREDGFNIKTIRVKDNVWKYVLEEKITKTSWQEKKRQENREKLAEIQDKLF